jgi:hypothetical protein
VTAVAGNGQTAEVARHQRGIPGSPVLEDDHYPPRDDKEGDRIPRATSVEEAAFLRLGPGAASWLVEAAAAGTRRIKAKMAQAVALSKLYSVEQVDRALGSAAVTARFAESDLLSILDYQSAHEQTEPTRRSEAHSLQPGTSAWSSFGLPSTAPRDDESDLA